MLAPVPPEAYYNIPKGHPMDEPGDPFDGPLIPFDAEAAARTEKEQAEREKILESTIMQARVLMERCGTETQVDRITLAREYSWTSLDGQRAYKVQEHGVPANGERGKVWESPLVFSVSAADAPEGEYLKRVNLAPNSVYTQTAYRDSEILGRTDDEALISIRDELRHKTNLEIGLRNLAGLAAATVAVAETTPPVIDTRVHESPWLQMSARVLRRLGLLRDANGRDAVLHTDDGRETYVTTNLGTDPDGRSFLALHNGTTRAEVGDALPDILAIRQRSMETVYDVHQDGRLALRTSNPDRVMYERADLYANIGHLNSHLGQMMEEGQHTAPLRDRVAMLMDRVAERAANGGPLEFTSARTMRIGEDEVDLLIHELDNRYAVRLWVASPDGGARYQRNLVIPKDRREPMVERGNDQPGRADIEDLVNAAIDRTLRPPVPQTRPEVEPWSRYHAAYLTVDQILEGHEINFHRDPAMGADISRRQRATITDQDGQSYRVERFGRLGQNDEVEMLYTRVFVNGTPYELTRNGFIPETAYRGGVTPKMGRRERRQANQDFEDFAAFLGR